MPMLRPRRQPSPAALLAVAVAISAGAAVSMDSTRLLASTGRQRAAVTDLIEQVARVVRAMSAPQVIAAQRGAPTLAAALRPAPSPVDDAQLPCNSEASLPHLLNLPPPRAIA